MEDLTQDEGEDNDILGDRPQAGEVSEVGSPSLANSEDLEGWGPHEPGLPERPVMDVSGWNMSAGAIGLMTGDVMIACSHEDAHLLGE